MTYYIMFLFTEQNVEAVSKLNVPHDSIAYRSSSEDLFSMTFSLIIVKVFCTYSGLMLQHSGEDATAGQNMK